MAPGLGRRIGLEALLSQHGWPCLAGHMTEEALDASWRVGLAAQIVNRRQQIERPESLEPD